MLTARFVSRPNRFVVLAELRDGRRVECHLADPGRLIELLLPGAELRLRPAPAGSARRTRFSVLLVRTATTPRTWVSVDSTLANRLAAVLLSRGDLRGAGRGRAVREEARHGRSRFDFRLDKAGARPIWVEVKSVTCVHDGVARFPDAPTERGRRHVAELAEMARKGRSKAMVLFIVPREDARVVVPYTAIDPKFAAALSSARRAGVMLRAARFRLEARGVAAYLGPLRVRTEHGPGSIRISTPRRRGSGAPAPE